MTHNSLCRKGAIVEDELQEVSKGTSLCLFFADQNCKHHGIILRCPSILESEDEWFHFSLALLAVKQPSNSNGFEVMTLLEAAIKGICCRNACGWLEESLVQTAFVGEAWWRFVAKRQSHEEEKEHLGPRSWELKSVNILISRHITPTIPIYIYIYIWELSKRSLKGVSFA